MGSNDNGLFHGFYQINEVIPISWIQIAGRFIQDKDAGTVGKNSGQGYQLLLPKA